MVYIATDGGLGIIRFVPFTLQKKATHYKQHLKDWGMIRLGMVTVLHPKPDGGYQRFFGDNDIGFTCHYLDALWTAAAQHAHRGGAATRREGIPVHRARPSV